jgi:hypothetical protein
MMYEVETLILGKITKITLSNYSAVVGYLQAIQGKAVKFNYTIHRIIIRNLED